jgi:hypothetical protein
MKPDSSRVLAAIDRNFDEANSAIDKLTAHDCLCRTVYGSGVGTDARTGFFAIARQALFNDMLAGAIRIFDDHKDVASLWYIIRCNEGAAARAAAACGISIADLLTIAPKLRHIRDKTHFHIDRKMVGNHPSSVWADADISDEELGAALRNAAALLAAIRQALFGGELRRVTAYDGADVQRIVDAYAASADGARE